MPQIRIKQLGLAAYIQMKGCELKKVENREFVFESEKTQSEWQVEYANSCCAQHDARVCQLRHHLSPR